MTSIDTFFFGSSLDRLNFHLFWFFSAQKKVPLGLWKRHGLANDWDLGSLRNETIRNQDDGDEAVSPSNH